MDFSLKKIGGLTRRQTRASVEFFYCKRDGVQEGAEKLLNCGVYEIVAFIALTAGCLGIGIGKAGHAPGEAAGYLGIGPLLFSFLINILFVGNYFAMIKRTSKEEVELFFPEAINKLLKINACIGFFLPYGIYAKGMLYRHLVRLYKKDKLPWVSQHDSKKERKKKFKQARINKRKSLDQFMKAQDEMRSSRKS